MKKICFVTASPLSLRVFMRNHMLRLTEQYEVTALSNFSSEDLLGDWLPGVRLVSIPIERQINLLADFWTLVVLLRFFRSERFDVVHSVTPKAGLLAMTAARMAAVPNRIHCFTGQVWATRKGLERELLKRADRVIALNANHLLTDSESQRVFLESETVVKVGQAVVLGAGSISGVDLERFRTNEEVRQQIRVEWGVPSNACLLLFVGRLNHDKGVLDLARAFAELSRNSDNIWLAVVGPDEAGIINEFYRCCGIALSRVRRVSYTATPEHAMMAADVFVLPSYREGFGSVVIEAASCGIPAVASRIYGLTDAIEENVTGLLHPPGDVAALANCLMRLCTDNTLRLKMGSAARARAQVDFSASTVTAALVDYYEKLLASGQHG
jgi:glycosyltransferase involved in cell wall biosynthesis